MKFAKLLKKSLYVIILLIVAVVGLILTVIVTERDGLVSYLRTVDYSAVTTSSLGTGQNFTSYTVPANFPKTSYSVLSFGAVGDGKTDDTVGINKALTAIHEAGGGTVVIPQGVSGDYIISAPLVIYSDTSLVVDPGVTITLATSSNCNMLIDAAHYTDDLTVPSPMHDISVEGGIWARGSNGGSHNNIHSIILGGNNILVEGATFTSSGGKYAVLMQNAIHFTVQNLFMDHTFSDGVHVQGPASFGLIQNIHGTTGDDMVSLTPYDWTDYTWGNEGDITDININDIAINQQAIANGVKVLGGKFGTKVLKSDWITISNVTGSGIGHFGSAIFIGDDIAQANTMNGEVDNVTINNVDVSLPNGTGNSLINILGSPTSLEIPNITISNVNFSSDMSAVISNTAKIGNLTISNVRGSTKTDTTNGILQNIGIPWAYISHLSMSNINLASIMPGGNLISSPQLGQGLGDVYLNNIYLYNFADIANISTVTNFYLSNVHLLENARLFLLNAGAQTTIQSSTDIYASSTSSVVSTGSTLSSNSESFPMNITRSDSSIFADEVLHLVVRMINLIEAHI